MEDDEEEKEVKEEKEEQGKELSSFFIHASTQYVRAFLYLPYPEKLSQTF
jgi:hypothetical protein